MLARSFVLLTALLLSATLGVSSASAESRLADIDDPADATPSLSGLPTNPDVKHVSVSYDSSGAVAIRVDFYNAINALDTTQNYAMSAGFSLGSPSAGADPYCDTTGVGSIYGQHHVFSNTTTFFDRATVAGFDGYLNFVRTVRSDSRSITISASSPALANRDFRCATYSLYSRRHSSVSVPASRYDESCDCWYVNTTLDSVGDQGGEYLPFFWFSGYEPDTPGDRPVRSRMRFRPHPGCRRIELWNWEVTPDDVGDVERPFHGRMVFEIRKRGLRREKRLRVVDGSSPVWRHVSPGLYRMKVWYTGDAYRKKSNVVHVRVRVKSC